MKKENSQSCWISRDTDGYKFKIQKPPIFCSPYKPSNTEEKQKNITFLQTTPSILTWQHINMHGTYDFTKFQSNNDNEFNYEEIKKYKIA